MNKHYAPLITTAVIAATALSAFAQSSSNSQSIVVTATRTRRQKAEVPASVAVITRDQIRASAAINADDLLREQPGVSTMRGTGMGQGMPSRINVRGVPGSQRTLLLLDGMPLDEASTRFISINEVPVHAIRRVELIRGPFSSLYGTDAFSGVMNIITDPATGQRQTEVLAKGGNAGFREASISHSDGLGKVNYSLTIDQRSIDNYVARDFIIERQYSYVTQDYVETRKDTENHEYRDLRALGSISVDLSDNSSLSTHWRYFEGDLGYGQKTAVTHPTPEDNVTKTRTAMIGTQYTSKWAHDIDFRFGGYVRAQERQLWGLDFSHFGTSNSPVYARSYASHESDEWKLDTGIDFDISDSQTVLLGADTRRTQTDFSPVRNSSTMQPLPNSAGTDPHIWNSSLFAQYEGGPWKGVTLVSGVRLDHHSEFGEAVSPRAGVSMAVTEDTTVRISGGRAFRAPALLELAQPDISYGYITFKGNPDLVPEYIATGDMEVEHKVTEDLSCRVALFYSEMDDLIGNRTTGTTLMGVNIDKARSKGIETEVNIGLTDSLDLRVHYTFQEAKDISTDGQLDYVPDETAGATVRLHKTFGRWRLDGSIAETYVGERGFLDWTSSQWYALPEYWRTDLAIKGTLDDRFWVGVSVQNATDEEYQESALATLAPARMASFEAGSRF